jgi:hypothetical protein
VELDQSKIGLALLNEGQKDTLGRYRLSLSKLSRKIAVDGVFVLCLNERKEPDFINSLSMISDSYLLQTKCLHNRVLCVECEHLDKFITLY